MGTPTPQWRFFYAQLALLEGWIDHARHQVKLMEKDPTGIYIGIGKAVTQRIKELNSHIT